MMDLLHHPLPPRSLTNRYASATNAQLTPFAPPQNLHPFSPQVSSSAPCVAYPSPPIPIPPDLLSELTPFPSPPRSPLSRLLPPCPTNSLASISTPTSNFLIFSPTARLPALTLHPLTSPTHPLQSPNAHLSNDPITNLYPSPPTPSELPHLLATTTTALHIAQIPSNQTSPHLDWRTHIPLPNITSASFNPQNPPEFVTLSPHGLHLFPPNTLYIPPPHDIQPLHPPSQYIHLSYSQHPRTLLLSNNHALTRLDLRHQNPSPTPLLSPNLDWHLPQSDKIALFTSLSPSLPFSIALATTSALQIFDTRMPTTPMLNWRLQTAQPIERMSISHLSNSQIILAISSREQATLQVFQTACASTLEETTDVYEAGFWKQGLPNDILSWAGPPLTHLKQTRHGGGPLSNGLALVGLSHADEVALAQWSVVDGLLVQKLRAGGGEREVYEEKRGLKRACLDSSVNIINAQWACRREGGMVDGMLYPVTRGFPGGGLMRGRRILFEIDVKDLQERICGGEDEIGGNLRICRADMRDIASVIQSREKDATEGMEEEDEEEGEEDGAFDGLLREFSGGVMLDEVCRSVRAGMAHGETAMGVEGLRGGIEDAGSVELEEVTWHESCRRGGHGVGDCYTGVHTGDELPDWVLTTVYFMKEEEGGRKEEEKEDGGFVHGGLYHDLFVRMKHYFFE